MRYRVDDHKGKLAAVEVEDLDWDAFRDQPLDQDALRCIAYMHDVEHHTICYLRDVLVTDAHRDHEITSFLTFWAFEEYFHGEALGRVLEAHGEAGSAVRVPAARRRAGRHDRLMPVYTMVANKLTPHVPAVHMTWGAINEWTAHAAYGRLAVRAGHPVLSELLARIKKQEGRHIDFYASQAERRLEPSRAARRMTRAGLSRFWTPVGAGLMPAPEVEHMATYLFGDEAGQAAAARIDRRIDILPGLAGMHLVSRRLARLTGTEAPVTPTATGPAAVGAEAPARRTASARGPANAETPSRPTHRPPSRPAASERRRGRAVAA